MSNVRFWEEGKNALHWLTDKEFDFYCIGAPAGTQPGVKREGSVLKPKKKVSLCSLYTAS